MSVPGPTNSAPSSTPDCRLVRISPGEVVCGVAPSRRNTSPPRPSERIFRPFRSASAVQLATEPAAHADAGIAAHEGLSPERRIKLVPQRLPAPRLDPGDMLDRGQSERNRGVERRGGLLALPVERGGVAHFGDFAADRVEHLEGGHHLARRMHGDLQPSSRQRSDALGDPLGRHSRAGQPLRPRGHHAPAARLRARDGRGGQRREAAGRCGRDDPASRGSRHH